MNAFSNDSLPRVVRKVKQCIPPLIVLSLALIALFSSPFDLFDESATSKVGDQSQLRRMKFEGETSESKYKILCSSTRTMMKWGSYLARCNTFKRWVDRCAPSVELTLGSLPKAADPVQYDATMYVKAIPPVHENLGKTFIDVVDSFAIRDGKVPEGIEIITQNELQSSLFPNHQTHIIEHWYNCDPSDTYIQEIKESNPLKVGAVCFACPRPDIPEDSPDVQFTMIDEEKEGSPIGQWFLKFMASEGWDDDKMNQLLENNEYGAGMLYYHVFRTFDVMIVTPKGTRDKLRYGSIQRIVSVMKSSVPVLVEVQGPAFEQFVDGYEYPCVYSKEGDKYPSLEEALERLKDVSARKKCQDVGLRIARDFDPDVMVKQLLNTLGYYGDFEC